MPIKSVSPYQFAFFRILLGVFLFIHFIELIPWAPELFSKVGLIPDGRINPTSAVFPNVLNFFDTALFVQIFIFLLASLSLLLTFGFQRRWVSLLLWYGWACLFNRNIFTGNPGLAFVGWTLLALAAIPSGEPWSKNKPKPDWEFPQQVFYSSWILLALGYSLSGFHKLGAPSWLNGSAIQFVLESPLARDTQLRLWLLEQPILLKLLTWMTLGLEVSFAFLAIFNNIRPWIWLAMIGMHGSILITIDFLDLTLGILIFHLFTFDRNWLSPQKVATTQKPIVFFDGVCGLCNSFIDFLLQEDRTEVFEFSPLQSSLANKSLPDSCIRDLNTIVVLQGGRVLIKSEAIICILRQIGGIWKILGFASILPRSFRDRLYDLVATHRYKIFGKKETCRLPTQLEKSRFI